jgi:hypothetical protein
VAALGIAGLIVAGIGLAILVQDQREHAAVTADGSSSVVQILQDKAAGK